jgi:hypothetical protein
MKTSSASASSDGGGEEQGDGEEGGGEEQGDDEEGGEVEDASPQETDTDAGADDGQQSLPQTTPLGPLEITPTLTPSPTLGISSPTIGLSPPPCPAGLCPTPMPTPVLPQSICIINRNNPACHQTNA